MKGRYPMINRTERRIIAELFINITMLIKKTVTLRVDLADIDVALLLVANAVGLGHAEDNPLNASKIANMLEMPRTTVLRKLDKLLEGNVIVRQGHNFLIHPDRALHVLAPSRLQQMVSLIAKANAELSDTDTKPIPLVLPLGYRSLTKQRG